MKTIFSFALIGCIAGMFLAGCGKTSEQKVQGDKQEVKDAKADYHADWQKFKTESDQQIKVNEDRIDSLKDKIKKADTKATVKFKKAVAELDQRNRDLKQKLEDYKDEGEGKWEEFKTNFNQDMDSIGKTMTDLFKDNN
jgi:type II secretory pathway component HofQ